MPILFLIYIYLFGLACFACFGEHEERVVGDKLMVAFRRPRNLKDALVRSKVKGELNSKIKFALFERTLKLTE